MSRQYLLLHSHRATIIMTISNLCALLKRAHCFLIPILFLLLLSFKSYSHSILLSEYALTYDDKEQWVLFFKQKTSFMRDQVLKEHPELKGTNLNSDAFHQATYKHISSLMTLTYQGKALHIKPSRMEYGGLIFGSMFAVSGLPKDPDFITIETHWKEGYEHATVLFRVAQDNDSFLKYFSQDQNLELATYDFATHTYLDGEVIGNKDTPVTTYLVIAIFLVGLLVVFFKRRTKTQHV